MDRSKVVTALAVALSVLVGGAAYALRAKHEAPAGVSIQFGALPLVFEGYQGQESFFDAAVDSVLRADTSTLRYYIDRYGQQIGLFVAYFGEQNYGEQIHSPRHCLPGGGWKILAHDRRPVAIAGQDYIQSNRMLVEFQGHRQVTYYYFLTRMGIVASEYKLKLVLAQAALTLQPRDAVFIRVMAPVGPDGEAAADARAQEFLASAIPLLSRGLPF